MAQKKTYWEMQKSFWKTPPGVVIWTAALLAIMAGGILALNFLGSPYPVIEFFDAEPEFLAPGQSSVLSCSVVGASLVEIDQDIGPVALEGSRSVSPSEDTIYRLIAVNGSRNRSVELKVSLS
jgi:hypothetical protein